MSCNLPSHLICAAIITKDKGLCYNHKNIRYFKIDKCGNIAHSMQLPTMSPLQRITTTIIQTPINLPYRYKISITLLIPEGPHSLYSNSLLNLIQKKQHAQLINTSNFSNYITLDPTKKLNPTIHNSLSVNQIHTKLLLPKDIFSPMQCLH